MQKILYVHQLAPFSTLIYATNCTIFIVFTLPTTRAQIALTIFKQMHIFSYFFQQPCSDNGIHHAKRHPVSTLPWICTTYLIGILNFKY